jgi:hypothetical protein
MSLPVEVIYMDSFLSYRTAPILGWRFVGPDNRRQPITRDYAERRTGARAARYRNGQVYDPPFETLVQLRR